MPQSPPIIIVDLKLKGLKKKLESSMNRESAQLKGQYGQIIAAFRFLAHFIDSNKFLPCWRELKDCTDMVQNLNQKNQECKKNISTTKTKINTASTVSCNELTGKIRLKLCHNRYHYSCSIQINDAYPNTCTIAEWGKACLLKMINTNLPPKIEVMMSMQAQDLVRKMQDGMSYDDAFNASNPIREPKDFRKQAAKDVTVRLTQEKLKSLKQDVETLKVVGNLRHVDADSVSWNAKMKAHGAKERKDARRNIKKITESEIAKDMAAEEKDKRWQIDEKACLAGYDISAFDGSNPQPSLKALVRFLIDRIWRLPEDQCPVCSTLVLPANPDELLTLYKSSKSDCESERAKKDRKRAKQKRPIRPICGCWYHYNCLDKFMREPPFGASCLSCKTRVYHPDWSDNMQTLEREWANKQARLREIEDVKMFL